MKRILKPAIIRTGFALSVLFMISPLGVLAFDAEDAATIGAAYMTHLFLHEVGHQVIAEDVGAHSQMDFFTRKNGRFYPGVSTHQNIPRESRLPYAAGGYRMECYTFEYALQSYRHKPTTYHKALMFSSCVDFLAYTLLANYVQPDNDTYDPNLIREETGLSKESLLFLVMAKSTLNTYRIFNENSNFVPIVTVDRTSAAFVIRFFF